MDDTQDLFGIIKEKLNLKEINAGQYSPLTLAYIGDAVYGMIIRTTIVDEANTNVNKLSREGSKLVSAKTQCKMIKMLMKDLTDEEKAVFRRGRNAKSNTKAKNATIYHYLMASGFETLIGYLYLTGKSGRMLEIINNGIKYSDAGFMMDSQN